MDLSRVAAEIRPRKPWEAVDLGVLMARRWWWPLTRVWVLVALPPALLFHLLPLSYLWLSPLLIWWLKPLWERPLLYVLSQALFGHLPDTGTTLRALPGLLRRHWLGPLTWQRLSPGRSMDLPVSQLEQLAGAERRNRVQVLHREGAAPAGWLTVIGVHLEAILALSGYLLIYFFIPEELDISFARAIQEEAFWSVALQNAIYFLAMTLVAPFYVACGFALYLNRRIRLEGWDIEIAFRRIVQKRGTDTAAAGGRSTRSAALSGVLLCLALSLASPPVPAQPGGEEAEILDRTGAGQRIEQILDGEDFHRLETVRTPAFLDGDDSHTGDSGVPDWLGDLLGWLADSLEVIIWALAIALTLLLVLRYRHWIVRLAHSGPARSPAPPLPETLFGLEVTPESLPEDIAHSALALWREGQTRAAVALLYRASLAQLVAQGLEVRDGSTEGECVSRVSARQRPATATYFATLTRLWQHLAYGHQPPSEAQFVRLCEQWSACMLATPKEAPQP